jgi:hypothetical protein
MSLGAMRAALGAMTRSEPPTVSTARVLDGWSWSDDADVLRLFALPAGSDVELDTLPLIEGLVALALDVGEMDEDVVALLARDEAEALLSIEELHGSCGHFDLLLFCG